MADERSPDETAHCFLGLVVARLNAGEPYRPGWVGIPVQAKVKVKVNGNV